MRLRGTCGKDIEWKVKSGRITLYLPNISEMLPQTWACSNISKEFKTVQKDKNFIISDYS